MEAFNWGLLIVAGASLIFAVVAFRQVMITTAEVSRTTDRANRLFDKVEKSSKEMTSPGFVGEVVANVITQDQKLPDGAPVMVTDVITGYMNAIVPALLDRIESKIPEYLPMILNHVYSSPQPPGGPQSPSNAGRELANQRWSGGLKAAKAGAKAAKAVGATGFADKIRSAGEVIGAVREIKPLIQDLRDLRGEFGGGSGNGGDEEFRPVAQARNDWSGPF